MKYKKGDLVRVKSGEWYNAHKDINGYVGRFVPPMIKFCGKVATVTAVRDDSYTLDLSEEWLFTDDMLEDMSHHQMLMLALLCKLMKLSNEDLIRVLNVCTEQLESPQFLEVLKENLKETDEDYINLLQQH